jgi:hypothetical protein
MADNPVVLVAPNIKVKKEVQCSGSSILSKGENLYFYLGDDGNYAAVSHTNVILNHQSNSWVTGMPIPGR